MAGKKYSGGAGWFIIKLHVYPFEVMVSVDEDFEVLAKRFRRYGIAGDDLELLRLGNSKGRAVMFDDRLTVIILTLNPDPVEMLTTIVHEALHATTFVLRAIGFKLKVGVSDEAYTYLLGYLTGEIVRRMNLLGKTPNHI